MKERKARNEFSFGNAECQIPVGHPLEMFSKQYVTLIHASRELKTGPEVEI